MYRERRSRKSGQDDRQGETSCERSRLWVEGSTQTLVVLATRLAFIGESRNGEKARYSFHGARGDRGSPHRPPGHPGAVRLPAVRCIQRTLPFTSGTSLRRV